jgi:hypothetical protein
MQSKFRNYAILLFLLTPLLFISCGGGGGGSDININVDNEFPLAPDFPSVPNTNFEARETLSFEVQPENRSQLRLKGVDGSITITGLSGANSVMITAAKRVASDSTQDAEEQLEELQVNVQSLANEIFVETSKPLDTRGRIYVVDYTITLPANLGIQITNTNGIVTISSIDNDVAVNNVSGNVTLTEIVGSAMVNLVSGMIESDVTLPLNGTIDINTVTGDINLAIPLNTTAGFLASVSIGNISVSNLALQNEVVTFTTRSGILGSGQGTIALETEAIGNISVSGF